MADPDGDPTPPQSTPPADRLMPRGQEASAVPSPALPESLTPAPRVNPPSVFNPKDAPVPPAPPAGFSDFLAWMQAFGGSQAAPPPPTEPPTRGLIPKQEKKFHRQEPAAHKDKAGRAEGGDAGRATPGRTEFQAPDPNAVVRKRRLKPAPVLPSHALKRMVPRLIWLTLLAGAYLYGRATGVRRIPAPVSAVPRTSLDRADPNSPVPGLIDQAMAAENKMDFAKATALLQQVQSERTRLKGVDYHLALLAFEDADFPRALSLLNRSAEKGEEVAACYNLRGTLSNRSNGLNHGLEDLEIATQVDPFNAKYFYFLGEALRRGGQPQAALKRLRQAKDRQREPALKGLYDLKVRLAQIELGEENEFMDSLMAELQRTPPLIDWLFTAAAVEMHRGHFDAAGLYLDKVAALTDQETMNTRLRDYFFYGFAKEKALARFYAPVVPTNAAATPAGTPLTSVEPPAPPSSPANPTPGLSLHP